MLTSEQSLLASAAGLPQPLERARFLDVATEEPIVAGVAGRYAAALFDLAQEQNKISEVEQDLVKFQQLYDESADLVRLVRSPVIASEDQAKALSAVLDKAGAGALSKNFFSLVARNRRLFAAPDMVRAFQALAAKARGEVTASVTSAHPLTDEQAAALKAALKETVGKDVTLSAKVDPSLIGGLVVKLGSRMVDSSLKTKLANLSLSLKGA
jgi:F-type H+-transporting ATPase subunit delta